MRKLLTIAAAGLLLCGGVCGQAFATPIVQSTIDATLSLSAVTLADGTGEIDFLADGEAVVFASDAFFTGDATSAIAALAGPAAAAPLIDEPLTVALGATGDAPGAGSAEAYALADGLVLFENNSATNTIRLDFILDYAVTAIAQVDDPAQQYAAAYTNFSVQSSQDADPVLEYFLAADTDTPDTSFSFADILLFSIFIGPQSAATLNVLADVYGFVGSDVGPAASTVPLPSMAGLFGAAALLALRRRKTKPQDAARRS